MRPRDFWRRYRVLGGALLASLVLHAAVMKGVPARIESIEPETGVAYTATLQAPPPAVVEAATTPAPPPRPRPAPRRVARRSFEPPPLIEPESLERIASNEDAPALASTEAMEKMLETPPPPEKVAMAAPTAPKDEPAPQPFPTDAIPEKLSISYNLTSAFADGKADYEWTRDGDNYRIHGEAQAEGFFTLFLEGRIVQETTGTVTPQGLRPERFVERRPNTSEEGLEFDWKRHEVTFERGDNRKTTNFSGDTLDWLSMIFQLAHVPPKPKGDTLEMAVFTQRKMYAFKLKVLGVEQIDIPMGHVEALHLRHVDEKDAEEVVDVWLGVQQHYLPVKMRYPVAKNRLVVEQSATRVSTR